MFKHYFEGIEYIAVGPIIGLAIFFVFFVVLIYLVVKADSGFISRMANMPFDDDSTEAKEDSSNSTQT
jgi:cytochrome c oxidase cbb3-type subunit 4